MPPQSQYAIRLLYRCPLCFRHVTCDRGPVIASLLCEWDEVPMQIVGVASGTPSQGGDWPDLTASRPVGRVA